MVLRSLPVIIWPVMTTEVYIIAIRSHFCTIFSFPFYWVAVANPSHPPSFTDWITVAEILSNFAVFCFGEKLICSRCFQMLSRRLKFIWNVPFIFKWHLEIFTPRRPIFSLALTWGLRLEGELDLLISLPFLNNELLCLRKSSTIRAVSSGMIKHYMRGL